MDIEEACDMRRQGGLGGYIWGPGVPPTVQGPTVTPDLRGSSTPRPVIYTASTQGLVSMRDNSEVTVELLLMRRPAAGGTV